MTLINGIPLLTDDQKKQQTQVSVYLLKEKYRMLPRSLESEAFHSIEHPKDNLIRVASHMDRA